jgi:hypothetical protein
LDAKSDAPRPLKLLNHDVVLLPAAAVVSSYR